MPISEAQLQIWSNQGAMSGSRDTYNIVKSILEMKHAPYASRVFDVFLQGSYGNDTNIYAESDVDIVIKLNSIFQYNIETLSPNQRLSFSQETLPIDYHLQDFKRDVLSHLQGTYGFETVTNGSKAINIAANSARRKTDVIVCMDFRKYYDETSYEKGIFFYDISNNEIINYPKQHSVNCTTKHQNTFRLFKPTVRIFKNLRNRLIDQGMIFAGDVPSYFIEGMLYNLPDGLFKHNFCITVANALNWLLAATPSSLVCANEQYYLIYEGSPVTWRLDKYNLFLKAACELWNQY